MNYALIKNGFVENLILADQAFADSIAHDWDAVVPSNGMAIGWSYAGGVGTAPPPPPVLPPAKTTSVTMRQARLALLEAGKLSTVQSAINSLAEPSKSRAQIEWDYSNEVHRNDSFVTTLGGALGMDDAALDALFAHAGTL
jgi:hypothetical protein